MISRFRPTVAALTGLAVAFAPLAAAAQPAAPVPPSAPASASAESTAGDAATKAKDYAGAATHYRASLAAGATSHAELGLANALYQAGRLGEAYDAYTEAQTTYGAKLAGADKTLVAARLKELAAKTGWLSIRLAEPGANVEVDGASVGTSPVPALLRVAVGSHPVRVTKEGFAPFEGRAEVTPDGKAVVDVTLTAAATKGHLVVQTAGEPLRVIVDGVDVGSTPWEGDLPPGPHEVGGRSSTSAAPAQTVNVALGAATRVDLAASSTAAHLQIRTSDGQGLITVDGAPKGQGAFSADVPPGQHLLLVSRDGYQPYERTLQLVPTQTWAETVTLSPIAAQTSGTGAAERAIEGIYGGLGLAPLFGVGGQGTELETNCDTLGAQSCHTPSPFGGGLYGYVGWTWNPVGFELFVAAAFDHADQSATFNGMGTTGNLPLAMPARVESFHFLRAGGLAAVRARAIFPIGHFIRATVAGGIGVSYHEMFMLRRAIETGGAGGQALYVPDPVGYLSPAVSAEVAVHVRVSPTLALAVGALMWADNASIAGKNAAPTSSPQSLLSTSQTGIPPQIQTPEYHLASGPQVALGPFLGLQFGP